MFDNKIAIIVKADLPDWQKLNAAAFLASSIAIQFPETHVKPFVNASGSVYLPFLRQPILIYKADNEEQIRRAFNRAQERDLHIGIYTMPLFGTKNEEGNHIEISKFTDKNQELAGLVLYGENKKVDKALDGLKFHT